MAKYDDTNPHPVMWTNRKLLAELEAELDRALPGVEGLYARDVLATIKARFVRSSSRN